MFIAISNLKDVLSTFKETDMKYLHIMIHETKQHDMFEVLSRRLYKRQMQFVILLSNVKEKIRIHNLTDIRTGVSYLLFLFLFYIEVYLIIL